MKVCFLRKVAIVVAMLTFTNWLPGQDLKVAGKVGIGTTSPEATLDVNGNTRIVGKLQMTNTSNGLSIMIGKMAGASETIDTDADNVFIGAEAGMLNQTGTFNTFLGTLAGRNSTGFRNTILGRAAGFNNTSGNDNTFVGVWAGLLNQQGTRNTYIGRSAGILSLGADFDRSIAIGYNAKVDCSNCAVIGGTGEDAVQLGIGTTSPSGILHVNGADPVMYIHDTEDASSNSMAFLKFSESDGSTGLPQATYRIGQDARKFTVAFSSDDVSAGYGDFFTVRDNGNIGIGIDAPACRLDVAGTVCSNGVTLTSDRRFKRDIRPLENALEKITRLEGVSYHFRTEEFLARNFNSGDHIGLIAQDLEQVFPQLVYTGSDGYKVVNYIELIPVLIEGMKEQQNEITVRDRLIKDLESKNQELEARLGKLEKMVSDLLERQPENLSQTATLSDANLEQNQPNPFTNQTSIRYFIPEKVKKAELQIIDAGGRLLKVIPIQTRGTGQTLLETQMFSSGTYIYALILDGQLWDTKRMVLTK